MITANNLKYNIFKQDLFKILVSFLLLSCVGGGLTSYWQNKQSFYQAQIEQQKYEREYATTLFEEISKLMEKQLSDFKMIIIDSALISKCKADYLIWNENNTRLRALTKKYFGESASGSFIFIDSQFKTLFEAIKLGKGVNSDSDLGTKVYSLELEIYKFNEQLIADLLSENVGNSRSETNQ